MDKRHRSPNYPALSLSEAIDKTALLYKNQRGHSAPREVAVKSMGYQSLNGASATAVSALHKYGLLERAGDGIKISERAMRILHPQSPEERAQAIREAAAEPTLFAELNARFPGSMPSEELLRNYLIRNGFAPTAVSSVILAYRDTQELVEREVGTYDSPATPQVAQEVQSPMQQAAIAQFPQIGVNLQPSKPGERSLGQWDFEGGGYVRIAAGGPVPTELALRMAEIMIRLRREEIKAVAAATTDSAEKKEGNENDPSPSDLRA